MEFNSDLRDYLSDSRSDSDDMYYNIHNLIENILKEELEFQREELENYEDTNEREFGSIQGSIKVIKKLIDRFND
jgi:hypothetical protein